MKQTLEGSKQSKPRLPLPPAPTADEQAKAQARAAERAKARPADNEKAKTKGRNGGLGGIVNNGRMRSYYLSPELSGGFNRGAGAAAGAAGASAAAPGGAGFAREADPAMSLSGTFKTEFFWIVSRANNCYYCQGHQESKLAADGLSEDTIAALDGDWSEFTPAERAAFAFTLKLTKTPQSITDADIAALRAHYKDTQILEIIQTVAGNNAMNRWTGSLAIPQESHRVYLTPTAPKYESARSRVAPLDPAATDGTSWRRRRTGVRCRAAARSKRRSRPAATGRRDCRLSTNQPPAVCYPTPRLWSRCRSGCGSCSRSLRPGPDVWHRTRTP